MAATQRSSCRINLGLVGRESDQRFTLPMVQRSVPISSELSRRQLKQCRLVAAFHTNPNFKPHFGRAGQNASGQTVKNSEVELAVSGHAFPAARRRQRATIRCCPGRGFRVFSN